MQLEQISSTFLRMREGNLPLICRKLQEWERNIKAFQLLEKPIVPVEVLLRSEPLDLCYRGMIEKEKRLREEINSLKEEIDPLGKKTELDYQLHVKKLEIRSILGQIEFLGLGKIESLGNLELLEKLRQFQKRPYDLETLTCDLESLKGVEPKYIQTLKQTLIVFKKLKDKEDIIEVKRSSILPLKERELKEVQLTLVPYKRRMACYCQKKREYEEKLSIYLEQKKQLKQDALESFKKLKATLTPFRLAILEQIEKVRKIFDLVDKNIRKLGITGDAVSNKLQVLDMIISTTLNKITTGTKDPDDETCELL